MAANQFDNQAMLQVGTVLRGIYRIDGYLASGGFGNTYLATNLKFKEKVAIKEFFMRGVSQRNSDFTSVSVSNSENVEMFNKQLSTFNREALRLRKLGSMNTSHIVKVYDIFEENNTAYYVMQYINGQSMGDILKKKSRPIDQGWLMDKLLPQLLDALDVVHKNNMWHLDIKPSNIMYDVNGNVILIDFGSSKQIDPSTGDPVTLSSTLSFTMTYAPLELQQYEYKKIGPWSDFYSLGATLYNLATKQKPPTASDLLYEGANAFKFGPASRDDFKRLVMWLMNNKIENRPQSVADIYNFLQKGKSAPAPVQPVPAQPVPAQPVPAQPVPVQMPVQMPVQPENTVIASSNFVPVDSGQEETVLSVGAGGFANNVAPAAPNLPQGNWQPPMPPKKKKSNLGWIIAGAAGLAAIVIGLILFFVLRGAGGDTYKAYVPADCKIVGKFDFKGFIQQSGVNQEKLFNDIKEYYGDGVGDLKNCGLDLASPFYMFARKNGEDVVVGVVGKVENREKAEQFVSKRSDIELKKETPYSYSCQSDYGVGINDDAFVIVATTASTDDAISSDLDRIMNREIEGNLADNKIFTKADDAKSFISLYADFSILPDEAFEGVKGKLDLTSNIDLANVFKQVLLGLDGSFKGGVFDINLKVSSENSVVQEKIDEYLGAFGTITSSDQGMSMSKEDFMGIVANANGEKLSKVLNEILSQTLAHELKSRQNKEIFDNIMEYVSKLNGNMTFAMKDENNMIFTAEGENFADGIASYIRSLGAPVSSDGFGYSLVNEVWFGYDASQFYIVTNQQYLSTPSKAMGASTSTSLKDVMYGRKLVWYFNFNQLLGDAFDSGDKDRKALEEVFGKVDYLTLSI